MSENEVEIRVTSRDHTKAGFESAERGSSRLNNRIRGLAEKFDLARASALALGPAAVPVLATAAGAAVATGVAVASAGAALGVFGVVAKASFAGVQELVAKQTAAQDALTAAVAKYGPKSKEAADAQKVANAALAGTTPAQKAAVSGYTAMTGAWDRFVARNQTATLGVLTTGMGMLGRSVSKLQPLFDIGARYAAVWVRALSGWVSDGGIDRAVDFLSSRAAPAIGKFTGLLTKGVGAFRGFTAEGGGLSRLMAYLATNGPLVVAALTSFATAAVHIAQAVTPLAPISLAIASALAKIIAAIPPDVITALVAGFVAMSVATRLWAVAQVVLNIALAANPIGIVVVAVAALVAGIVIAYRHSETFRGIVNALWAAIKTGAIAAAQGVLWFVGKLLDGLSLVFGALGRLPGPLGAPFRAAQHAVDTARGKVREFQGALDNLHGKTVPVGARVTGSANAAEARLNLIARDRTARFYVSTSTSSANAVENMLNRQLGRASGGITGAAGGGPRSRLTMVGEHGRELVDLPAGSRVRSNPDTERMMAGPGGGGTVVIEVRSGGSRLDDLLVEVLRRSIRNISGGDVQLALGR